MRSACYVYAIVSRGASLPVGVTGFGDSALSTVIYGELAAVTSLVDRNEFRPTAEQVLNHEAIVEAVRGQCPALPVRFGTILSDSDAVARSLAQRYDVLVADLARLGDKVELGLTVLWDETVGSDGETVKPFQASSQADGPTDAHGPGARFLLTRLAEHRRVAELRERANAVARDLDKVLSVYAIERRQTILPTPRLVLRSTYLLDPFGLEAFREAFDKIHENHPELHFLLTGPWPPYSFISKGGSDEQFPIGGQLLTIARQLAGDLLGRAV